MENGWIKIHRKIVNWEWYDDANTYRVFMHLLFTANHSYKVWRGIEIKPGQKITSYRKLSKELRLGLQEIRTSISRLKSTHELTHKTTTKYSLFTILNWHKYQTSNTQKYSQLTTNKKDKNIKNILSATPKKATRNKNMNHLESDELPTIRESGEEVVPENIKAHKNRIADTTRVIKEFDRLWVELISSDHNKKPRGSIPMIRKSVIRALKLYTANELIELIPIYFKDKFYKPLKYPIWTMMSEKVLNQLKHEK